MQCRPVWEDRQARRLLTVSGHAATRLGGLGLRRSHDLGT
jgi:hypothetical protein